MSIDLKQNIKTHKVKLHKVTQGFCQHCKEYVSFHLDKIGCVCQTDKGVIIYVKLIARCPHCHREIYVPAVNDINIYRRNKTPESSPMMATIAGELAQKMVKQDHNDFELYSEDLY